jgi:Fe2+ transport system protein FeoA
MASLPHHSSSPVPRSTAAQPVLPLSKAPVGCRRVIIRIDGQDRAELEREGILAGSEVVVAARTPLGGPLIVEVGRARLALSAGIAAQVETRPFTTSDEPAR